MILKPDFYIAKYDGHVEVGDTRSLAMANLQLWFRQEGAMIPDGAEVEITPIFTQPMPGLITAMPIQRRVPDHVENIRRKR